MSFGNTLTTLAQICLRLVGGQHLRPLWMLQHLLMNLLAFRFLTAFSLAILSLICVRFVVCCDVQLSLEQNDA